MHKHTATSNSMIFLLRRLEAPLHKQLPGLSIWTEDVRLEVLGFYLLNG